MGNVNTKIRNGHIYPSSLSLSVLQARLPVCLLYYSPPATVSVLYTVLNIHVINETEDFSR